MMRTLFTLMWILILALVFFGMWRAWRGRSRRDAGVVGANTPLTGEVLAHFGGVEATSGGLQYVSTTPVGQPLTRVAAPGLRYRGPAEATVRTDGVTIEVVGEQQVHVPAEQVLCTAAAGRRVGKAVEAGGLGLLVWRPDPAGDALESSFRFANREEQERFDAAVAGIAHPEDHHQEGIR